MLMRALSVHIAHETSGAARIRHSLRPLIGEGEEILANLGRNASREREHTFRCHRPRKRPTQYSRDADDRTDKLRRTGSPAFAEDDSGGWGRALHIIASQRVAMTAVRNRNPLVPLINPPVTSFLYTLPTISRPSRACERVVSCCVSISWPRWFHWLWRRCSPAASLPAARGPASKSAARRSRLPPCPGRPSVMSVSPAIPGERPCGCRSPTARKLRTLPSSTTSTP